MRAVDARRAVLNAVSLDDSRLKIVSSEYDLRADAKIYSVALGKAAGQMALALDDILGSAIAGGTVSTSTNDVRLSSAWQVFAGGHPVPNQASIDAAQASFDMLEQADEESAIIIFLVSGGGSAQMELPRDERVTLNDLTQANHLLVSCGARVAEINAVRRLLSAVKGGRLSRRAPRAAQVTLVISDTNSGDEQEVASGPTISPKEFQLDPSEIISRYHLAPHLPSSILRAIEESVIEEAEISLTHHRHYVLLDNEHAVASASEAARTRGYKVEIAQDINEQTIDEGCVQLLARLLELRSATHERQAVCLISGGEFACPVRGEGVGGRNSETALRLAIETDKLRRTTNEQSTSLVSLSAGTDGIDGNSAAAGAMADSLTLARARFLNLDARKFLAESDAYNFFALLGDAVVTGATGTNVRDLRILLAD